MRLIFLADRCSTAMSSSSDEACRVSPLNGDGDETKLRRPIVILRRVRTNEIIRIGDAHDPQRRQHRINAADGWARFDL
jgi:hypothetical protein